MSLSDDLQSKLEPAVADLQDLAGRLDELTSLEESLHGANEGLAQASSSVVELAAVARAAQESLAAALASLEQAANAMAQIEPALRELSERSQAINQLIEANHEVTQRHVRELSALVSEQAQAVNQSISAETEQRAKDAAVLKRIGTMTLFALGVVAILALLTFINTQ